MARLTLDITALGHRGDGLAQADGKTIIVPFTLPGERVVADVNDGRGAIVEIAVASPDRRQPVCRHFGACGGCSVQHLAAGAYREWKLALLGSALKGKGITGHTPELLDAHGEGRRRVCFHVRRNGDKAAIGFMAPGSHQLVAIDACPVLAPALAAAPEVARIIASQFIATDASFDVLLTATATGLDCDVRGLRKGARWPDDKLARLLNRHAVVRLSIHGEPLLETGKPMVRCGMAMVPLPPGGFLQATAEAERILAEQVVDRTRQARSVADLFCGIGPFALRLAEHQPVTAVDLDAPALAALEYAFRHTPRLKPVITQKRDLLREPLTPSELAAFDAVVLDPPRQGAEGQARQLARSRVGTVILVSCDAASFARDAAILVSGGYRLTDLVAIDQFKWSPHIEIVASFARGLSRA